MELKTTTNREWVSAGYEGAERAILRITREGGRTSIVRLKAGARGPRHKHGAGEDALVISGKIAIGGHTMVAGDYLYTEAGEEHDLVALEDSVIYASTARPVTILE